MNALAAWVQVVAIVVGLVNVIALALSLMERERFARLGDVDGMREMHGEALRAVAVSTVCLVVTAGLALA